MTKKGYWQIDMDDVTVSGESVSSVKSAILDSGTSLLVGPSEDVKAIASKVVGVFLLACCSFRDDFVGIFFFFFAIFFRSGCLFVQLLVLFLFCLLFSCVLFTLAVFFFLLALVFFFFFSFLRVFCLSGVSFHFSCALMLPITSRLMRRSEEVDTDAYGFVCLITFFFPRPSYRISAVVISVSMFPMREPSNQDQVRLVTTAEYIGCCVYRRSPLLWSSVIF